MHYRLICQTSHAVFPVGEDGMTQKTVAPRASTGTGTAVVLPGLWLQLVAMTVLKRMQSWDGPLLLCSLFLVFPCDFMYRRHLHGGGPHTHRNTHTHKQTHSGTSCPVSSAISTDLDPSVFKTLTELKWRTLPTIAVIFELTCVIVRQSCVIRISSLPGSTNLRSKSIAATCCGGSVVGSGSYRWSRETNQMGRACGYLCEWSSLFPASGLSAGLSNLSEFLVALLAITKSAG